LVLQRVRGGFAPLPVDTAAAHDADRDDYENHHARDGARDNRNRVDHLFDWVWD
jgi:hypothetical protein